MHACFFIVCILQALTHPIDANGNRVMMTSWYGHGRHTADGRRFDREDPHICAHRKLPFGTELRVTNPRNGRSIVCKVRDRGPFIRGRQLDVSYGAAVRLGIVGTGVARLRVAILSRP